MASITKRKDSYFIAISCGYYQNGRSRTLILPPYCLSMLRRYRAEQDGYMLSLGDAVLSTGTNIKNVASRLGHTQLKTTNRYVHAVEQVERDAANTLEINLGGKLTG